jgi:hypothetical protein
MSGLPCLFKVDLDHKFPGTADKSGQPKATVLKEQHHHRILLTNSRFLASKSKIKDRLRRTGAETELCRNSTLSFGRNALNFNCFCSSGLSHILGGTVSCDPGRAGVFLRVFVYLGSRGTQELGDIVTKKVTNRLWEWRQEFIAY